MNFIRYSAPNGEAWRVEDGERLLSLFEIPIARGKDELPLWHEAFAPQNEVFEMLRRLFAINPALGVDDPALLTPQTEQEVASARGMALREVRGTLEAAKAFWLRRKALDRKNGTDTAYGSEGNNGSNGRNEVNGDGADPDGALERRLAENGFAGITDENERAYIANRIVELELWLESEQSRPVARSLIQQEVMVFFILDPAIAAARADMDGKKSKGHDTVKSGEQLLKLMKERRDAQSGIESTMKQLGMDEAKNATLKKKMSFKDTISTLLDGMARFYSDADNALIDGVFSAAEIQLLTTPLTLRPAQYRPDLVVSCWEAMQHFWERDYVPTPVGRQACRKLRAGFEQALAMIRSEDGESIADMGEVRAGLADGEDAIGALADGAKSVLPLDLSHAPDSKVMPPVFQPRMDDLAV
jgi:hypothetical protein